MGIGPGFDGVGPAFLKFVGSPTPQGCSTNFATTRSSVLNRYLRARDLNRRRDFALWAEECAARPGAFHWRRAQEEKVEQNQGPEAKLEKSPFHKVCKLSVRKGGAKVHFQKNEYFFSAQSHKSALGSLNFAVWGEFGESLEWMVSHSTTMG